jgi:hypothetical protein
MASCSRSWNKGSAHFHSNGILTIIYRRALRGYFPAPKNAARSTQWMIRDYAAAHVFFTADIIFTSNSFFNARAADFVMRLCARTVCNCF